jgi:glycosyltransferase involved in cell wall biosynthesis
MGWPRGANAGELTAAVVATLSRGLELAGCLELIDEISLITMLRHAILATAPDLVVSHLDMTNVRTLAALQETGLPVIACEHTDTTQVSLGRWQNARRALYRGAAAVVAPHPVIADWLRRCGAPATAIPNPLMAPPPANIELNRSRRRLVSLTRLSPEKRPALLVRAFASIAGEFPDWDLAIYGNGPLRKPLGSLVGELAPGRIHLHGFIDDAYAILRSADLFVSSSWVEGFGNGIWEALACGVPVVATECGAPVRSLVRDGIDGVIVRSRGISALAAALDSLMGNDARRMSFAARAPEILNRFPMEASLELWEQLIERVTARASSPH